MAGDGPQVSGTLRGPDGRVSAFVGWVGLLALLQQAIAEPAPDPPPTAGTELMRLSARSLTVSYGGVRAVDGVSLDVEAAPWPASSGPTEPARPA